MRKKILLAIAICSGAFAVQAQSLQIELNGTNITGDTAVFYDTIRSSNARFEHKNFDIINTTANAMTIKVRRIEQVVLTGTADALCWGSTCFGDQDAGTNPVWEPDDETASTGLDTLGGIGFIVYHVPKGVVGESIYKYEFFDKNTRTTEGTVYVKFVVANTVGIDEFAAGTYKMDISPNPAQDQFFVDYAFDNVNNDLRLQVYNLVGEQVIDRPLNAIEGRVGVPTSDLASGAYFVSIRSEGRQTAVKKLIVR